MCTRPIPRDHAKDKDLLSYSLSLDTGRSPMAQMWPSRPRLSKEGGQMPAEDWSGLFWSCWKYRHWLWEQRQLLPSALAPKQWVVVSGGRKGAWPAMPRGLDVWVPFMLCSQINTMLLPLCCDLRGRAEGQVAHRMMIYLLACREMYFIRWRVFSASAASLAGHTSTGCPESSWLALLQSTEPHRWLEDILRTHRGGWGQQPLWQIFLSLRNGTFAMHFSARVCVLFRWKKSAKLLFSLFSYMPYEKQVSVLIVTHYTQIECQGWQVSFTTSQSSSPSCLNLPQTTSKLMENVLELLVCDNFGLPVLKKKRLWSS